jgi:hypothetical protein
MILLSSWANAGIESTRACPLPSSNHRFLVVARLRAAIETPRVQKSHTRGAEAQAQTRLSV